MCLTIRQHVIDKVQARAHGKKSITGYKVLIKDGYSCLSLNSACYNHSWKSGVNKSNRPKDATNDNGRVYEGMHIFLNKKDAEYNKKNFYYGNGRVVSVRCYMKDFVSAGVHSDDERIECAVFTQVTLEKRTYDKAIR